MMTTPVSKYLVAVDQSMSAPGVAVFRDGLLIASTVLTQKKDLTMPIARRTTIVAFNVLEWIYSQVTRVDEIVVEWPQIYTAVKSKGNPNDLLGVCGVGAALVALVLNRSHGVATCKSPTPAEWAGQLPKLTKATSVMDSPRTTRVMSRLSPEEKKHAVLKHDAIDAIGIGLWALGRFAPTRNFPGAT